jgi:hypothetical protein
MDIGQGIWFGIAVGVMAFSWYAAIMSVRATSDIGERGNLQRAIYWASVGVIAVLVSIVLYRNAGVL